MEEWLKTFWGNMADVITGNAALLYIANTCVSVSVVNGGEKLFGGREEAVFLFAPLVGKWRTSAAESESSV
ncbi:MAG: hypothetical protein HFG32_11530 [Eubacterium sp.]|jgi:hypothetical protein|nr:hypothetical protein [Eubacterium sp.]